LRMRESLSGPDADLAKLLQAIGEAERAHGKLAQAEAHLRRAWEIRCDKLGPQEATVTSAYHLAATLLAQGRPDAALLPVSIGLAQIQHFAPPLKTQIALDLLLSQVWHDEHWFAAAKRVRQQVLELCEGHDPDAEDLCREQDRHRET